MNRCLCLRFDDDARNRWIRRPDTFRDSNSLARNKPSFVSKIWNDTRAVSTPFFSLFFFFRPLLRSPFHFVTNNSSHEWYGNCAISIAALYRSRKIHSPWLLSLAIKFRIPLPSLFPFFSLSLFLSVYCFPGAVIFPHFAPLHLLSRINREKSWRESRLNNGKVWIVVYEASSRHRRIVGKWN